MAIICIKKNKMVRILMVNKMNEDIELLTHIYKNAQMGEYTTSTLINRIKNKENKIKPILEKEIKKYEDFVKRSKKILKSLDSVPKAGNSMAKISSTIGITVETLKDNSDSALAQMLVEGMTMGVVSTATKISQYIKVSDRKIIKLARSFQKFQEEEIELLKAYM